MRFLVLCSRRIESRQSGYDLRVANLCAHLPGEAHLVVAPLRATGGAAADFALDGVFTTTEELAPLPPAQPSPWRHVRRSDDHYLALTRPAAFAATRDRLREIVRERGITDVLVFGGDVAELVAELDGPRVVLDVCDSAALTARRALDGSADAPRGLRALKERLAIARKRATESRFARRFDLVATISDPDSRAVEGSRVPAGTVRTVPNGVDEAFVGPLPDPGTRRGIVFWGNLAFGPNREALRFLVQEVYLPHLRDADVELCVVGGGAPAWLVDLAADEPGITLAGFVDDLRPVVTRYPIMINPMRTGSGLKNKVLEAFGLGLVVVSTPLGVEALPTAQDGTHLVCAEDPAEIAAAVRDLLDDPDRRRALRSAAHALVHEHHRWDAIGQVWRSLLAGVESPAGERSG